MKLIRMTKTMAGPNGVRHPGMKPFTVPDEEAAQLVTAEAAEVIATIADPVAQDDGLPVEIETATVDPVVETAARPKATKKRAG